MTTFFHMENWAIFSRKLAFCAHRCIVRTWFAPLPPAKYWPPQRRIPPREAKSQSPQRSENECRRHECERRRRDAILGGPENLENFKAVGAFWGHLGHDWRKFYIDFLVIFLRHFQINSLILLKKIKKEYFSHIAPIKWWKNYLSL